MGFTEKSSWPIDCFSSVRHTILAGTLCTRSVCSMYTGLVRAELSIRRPSGACSVAIVVRQTQCRYFFSTPAARTPTSSPMMYTPGSAFNRLSIGAPLLRKRAVASCSSKGSCMVSMASFAVFHDACLSFPSSGMARRRILTRETSVFASRIVIPSTTASTRQLSARPVASANPSPVRLGAMIAPRVLASFSSVRISCASALRFILSQFASPVFVPSTVVSTTPSAATSAANAATSASTTSATTVTGVAKPLSSSTDATPCSASGPTLMLSALPRA
mmetsp:Transcript_73427/g.201647  ORF Transcript_73427/g.201647 Transcript_73427/m.201647 type:complete len:276 (+) Transcript_73427:221-1048(+)